MRLINTATLQLEEFFDSNRPAYAILSHTWGSDEVNFQEWLEWQEGSASQRARIELKRGFQKIQNTCRTARRESYDFVWVDTNCIDKRSSAELSEAINSMFAWYRDSAVCFVLLEDYLDAPKENVPEDAFGTCRWFTRGWTLQELLAPTAMRFYNRSWECIGSKDELIVPLEFATGVESAVLNQTKGFSSACIAKRMSWASERQTTRVEDTAYCLLGLFGINMPLLYGEGIDAFRRLQEEIMKVSADQSIFAWDWSDDMKATGRDHWVSMLAPHPRAFRNCFNIERQMARSDNEFVLTNRGLTITPLLLKTQNPSLVYAALGCTSASRGGLRNVVCIPLHVTRTASEKVFSREDRHFLAKLLLPAEYMTMLPTTIRVPRLSELRDVSQPVMQSTPSQRRALLQTFRKEQGDQVQHMHGLDLERLHSLATIRSITFPRNLTSQYNGFCVRVYPRHVTSRVALVVLWTQDFQWTQVCFTPCGSFCRRGDDDQSISYRVLEHVLTETYLLPKTTSASQAVVRVEVDFSCRTLNGFGDMVFPMRCSSSVVIGSDKGMAVDCWGHDTSQDDSKPSTLSRGLKVLGLG